jgi:hypothetical protein
MAFVLSFQTALQLVERLGAVGVVLSSAELLAVRTQLTSAGMLNYEIPQTRARWLLVGPGALLAPVFQYPGILGLLLLRLGAAVVLVTGTASTGIEVLLVGVIALTSIALSLRTPFGNDGADQMTMLIFSSLFLALVAGTEAAAVACLWFLAAQTCLSYLTAGAAKATAVGWRNGDAIRGIFRTTVYGHPLIGRLVLRHQWMARLAGWSVVLTECLFVLALIAPQPLVFLFLIGGLSFHLASAAFMGLNTFLWSFAGTYPAILFCAARASLILWGHP